MAEKIKNDAEELVGNLGPPAYVTGEEEYQHVYVGYTFPT